MAAMLALYTVQNLSTGLINYRKAFDSVIKV